MAGKPAHRNGDLRSCDATTTVLLQTKVFVNSKLWAVKDDINSHGNGQLIPTYNKIYINGIKAIMDVPDNAKPDNAGHTNPMTAQGSGDTYGGNETTDTSTPVVTTTTFQGDGFQGDTFQ